MPPGFTLPSRWIRNVAEVPIPFSLDRVIPGDRALFHDVNEFARSTGWLHAPALFYANDGVVLFAALLLLGWWLARGTGTPATVAAALWAPLGALLALGVNQLLVGSIREPRPYDVLAHPLVLAHRSTDYSFPSDHAVMAGAVAAGLFVVNRRLGIVAAVAAVLMSLARVYIAAHWPADVLAGLVVGAVITLVGLAAVRPLLTSLVRRLARTPLAPLLVVQPDASTD